ncbi:MAG: winged helix-turn-helix domain-containing protein [Nanoarchaeota archaeon]
MELESLFVSTKWDVLQAVAKRPMSPLQLSKKFGTSIANISTQLRLLEAAKFVKKQRTGSAKAGKPRYLFSITKDFLYVTSVADQLATKQLLQMDPHHKTTAAVWNLAKQYHGPLMKFFYMHEELLEKDVYVTTAGTDITLEIEDETTKMQTTTVNFSGETYTIKPKKAAKKMTGATQVCFSMQ